MAFAQNQTYKQYHLNNSLNDVINSKSQSEQEKSFINVNSRVDLWTWSKTHMIDILFADKRSYGERNAKVVL